MNPPVSVSDLDVGSERESSSLAAEFDDPHNKTMHVGLAVPIGLLPVDKVVLIVLYSTTTLLAVVGNLAAIVVFTVGRRSRSDLRWFLGNLAAADLIMALFCMPFTFTTTMLDTWIFTAPMCPIVMFFQMVSVIVSVFTSVAVGVDRYWVVNYPLRSRITKSRSPLVICAIWLVAGLMSSVQLVIGRSNRYVHASGVQAYDCGEVWPEPAQTWRRAYTFFVLTITYLLPLALLSFTYGSVSCKLWQRKAPGNADEARDSQQLKSKRKVIKMLVIVVTLFAVCWIPLHAFTLVVDYHPELTAYETLDQKRFFVGVYYCAHWLAMSNSFVNPIIYGFLNDCFRSDLKQLIRALLPCCRLLPCCFITTDAPGVGHGDQRRSRRVMMTEDSDASARRVLSQRRLPNASSGRRQRYGTDNTIPLTPLAAGATVASFGGDKFKTTADTNDRCRNLDVSYSTEATDDDQRAFDRQQPGGTKNYSDENLSSASLLFSSGTPSAANKCRPRHLTTPSSIATSTSLVDAPASAAACRQLRRVELPRTGNGCDDDVVQIVVLAHGLSVTSHTTMM